MKNRKKFVVILTFMQVLLLCMFLVISVFASEKIEMKIGIIMPRSSPMFTALSKFVEEAEKRAPGRFDFKIYPDSQLGGTGEEMTSTLMGTIQGCVVEDGGINQVDVLPIAEMGNTPFLIKGPREEYDMLDDFFGDILKQEYKKRGLEILAFYLVGGVDVGNSVRPLEKPEDFKRLKIRTWKAKGPYMFLEAMGALPLPMAFGEVYTALQQGQIDGVISSSHQFLAMGFNEVCKYQTDFNLIYNYFHLVINKKWFDSLPQDLQEVLIEAGRASQIYCRDVISPEFNKTNYENLEKAGVQVKYLSPEEREVFVNATKPIWPEFRKMIGPEEFDRVVKYMENK